MNSESLYNTKKISRNRPRKRRPETGNFSLKLSKKFKAGFKKVVKKLAQVVKDSTIYAPLLPLAPAMKHFLKKKKIPVEGSGMEGLVKTFSKKVLKKNFDDIDADENNEHWIAAVAAIVPLIIKFFKNMKSKKDAGNADADEKETIAAIGTAAETLNDENYDQAGTPQKTTVPTLKANGEIKPATDKQTPAKNNTLLFAGGAVALIAVFYFMKK